MSLAYTRDPVGIILTIFSALFMATIGVFSKITGLPAVTISFFRLALGAIFLALFLLATRQIHLLWRWPTWTVLLSGVLLAGFILLYVQAMHLTTMANAIMIIYLAPLAAAIYAHFKLKEYLAPMGWACIALALLGFGAMLEFHLDFTANNGHLTGLALAGLAMGCYAGFILINRLIQPTVPVLTRSFYQLTSAALVCFPLYWTSAPPVPASAAPWLLGTGLIPGFLAITFAVMALSRLPAATFGTLAYFEPVAVVIFGWTLFGETLSPLQLVGCALIIISGCTKIILAHAQP